MSSVTSHVKSSWSAQLKSTSALGYLHGTYVPLNPEMPATNTFVSTTTRLLLFFFLGFGGNRDLRRAPLSAISPNRLQDFFFGDLPDVLCRFHERSQKLFLPSSALAAAGQVLVEFSAPQSFLNLFP